MKNLVETIIDAIWTKVEECNSEINKAIATVMDGYAWEGIRRASEAHKLYDELEELLNETSNFVIKANIKDAIGSIKQFNYGCAAEYGRQKGIAAIDPTWDNGRALREAEQNKRFVKNYPGEGLKTTFERVVDSIKKEVGDTDGDVFFIKDHDVWVDFIEEELN